MKNTQLKQPILVYILAFSFIVSPICNITLSLISSGYMRFVTFDNLPKILMAIPIWDWLWMGMVFVSGVALLRKHKLTWSLAVVTLLLVSVLNFYKLQTDTDRSSLSIAHHIFNISVTLSVFIVFYYFRFPYLDRRMTWVGFAPRFDVHVESDVSGTYAIMESLSNTGARFKINQENSTFEIGKIVQIKFANTLIPATVVQWISPILRVKFVEISTEQKHIIETLVKNSHKNKEQVS